MNASKTVLPNCHLLLGSNLGDTKAHLAAALKEIEKQVGHVAKKSHLYETEPWGKASLHSYLNQAVEITTSLSPQEVLSKCLEIEAHLGRVRKKERWEDRILDIDLILYGEETAETDFLVLPHPRMALRRFVLLPLAEIAPDLRHPVLHTSIAELLQDCPDQGKVEKLLGF